MRAPAPKDTNLQQYLSEALARSGRSPDWRAYVHSLRSFTRNQAVCRVYADVQLTLDPSTLARWLRELDPDAF